MKEYNKKEIKILKERLIKCFEGSLPIEYSYDNAHWTMNFVQRIQFKNHEGVFYSFLAHIPRYGKEINVNTIPFSSIEMSYKKEKDNSPSLFNAETEESFRKVIKTFIESQSF